MARNLSPKCKQCRREGAKLFLKAERCSTPKCAMVKRNFPPGVHGIKGYGRMTDYGKQLREKQKAKRIYKLLETQFSNYFNKASHDKMNTAAVLLQLLEMRLDNVIFRAGFVNSRSLARQLISHGHLLVNGKKINIPSYHVKVGNIISIKPASNKLKIFNNLKENIKKSESVSWLTVDADKFEVKVTDKPKLEEAKGEFDIRLVIEFYSK
jgi:small subunit ribosomal protein S4